MGLEKINNCSRRINKKKKKVRKLIYQLHNFNNYYNKNNNNYNIKEFNPYLLIITKQKQIY